MSGPEEFFSSVGEELVRNTSFCSLGVGSQGAEDEWDNFQDSEVEAAEEEAERDFEYFGRNGHQAFENIGNTEAERDSDDNLDLQEDYEFNAPSSDSGEEAAEEDGSEGEQDIFVGEMDPMALLKEMEDNGGQRDGAEAVEMIASARRAAGHSSEAVQPSVSAEAPGDMSELQMQPWDRDRRRLHGATIEDIYESHIFPIGGRRRRRRRRGKGRPRKRKELPEDIQEMLSGATADFALGRHKQAATSLTEVIRRMPNHPDAYRIMGLLNEDMGNKRRALAFFMLEAAPHEEGPSAVEARLAAVDIGFRRQAVYCLQMLIRRCRNELQPRLSKVHLLCELGEPRKAISDLEAMQRSFGGNHEVPQMLARLYHSLDEPWRAIRALEKHVDSFPQQTDLTDINMLCELYMQCQQYPQARGLIDRAEAVLCAVDGLPIDLQVKRGICLFHMGEAEAAAECFQPLLQLDDCTDLITQVADLYRTHRQWNSALQFYEILLDLRPSDPNLLQHMSACHKELGSLDSAMKLFEDAISAGQLSGEALVECALSLCELKIETGNVQEARRLIAAHLADGSSGPARGQGGAHRSGELRAWLARVHLRLGNTDGFLQMMLPCIYSTLKHHEDSTNPQPAERHEHLRNMPRLRHVLQRRQRLRKKGQLERDGGLFTPGFRVRDRRPQAFRVLEQQYAPIIEEIEQMAGQGSEQTHGAEGPLLKGLLTPGGQFGLLLQVVNVLVRADDAEARGIALELIERSEAILSKDREKHVMRDNLRILKIEISCRAPAPFHRRCDLRSVFGRWPTSLRVINLYCRILARAGGRRRLTRSIQALRNQFPTSVPLILLAGHSFMMNGTPADAINEYVHAFHQSPEEPLVSLSLGVALLKDAMSFRASHRHRSILQAFAFLCNYRRLRGNSQEAAYNIGRAMHDIGLLHLAVPFYEEALSLGASPSAGGCSGPSDLSREAAHNLALIYRGSGAIDM
eukprot:CAMPEP_0177584482 /NCGR_PEP_ID=MMETSP0419_2-20121207/3923_1 /TAXON_ID=582737 /ORGANISM="Tetraselmis sp., Strain GSL018" /LENGTH=972 /DNA_ID=CAMNT_0019074031 /DNA_START=110 /DNA_END=3024 /DNA_ORIENTATION=-